MENMEHFEPIQTETDNNTTLNTANTFAEDFVVEQQQQLNENVVVENTIIQEPPVMQETQEIQNTENTENIENITEEIQQTTITQGVEQEVEQNNTERKLIQVETTEIANTDNHDIHSTVNVLLNQQAKNSVDIKDSIDNLATLDALKEGNTISQIVDEKTQELVADAKIKKTKAEAEQIGHEANKIQKETEKDRAEEEKAQTFFNNNKEILKYWGCWEKQSLKSMQNIMKPALVVYNICQFLLLPITLVFCIFGTLIVMAGDFCNKFKKRGVGIVITLTISAVVVLISVFAYILLSQLIANL